MKIAYQNEVPEQVMYQRFIGEIGEQNSDSGALQYASLCTSQCVIAAYDQEDLIGIGTMKERDVQKPLMDIAVSSSYRQREVEQNIKKLLKAACQFG
ncbi:hypothetical protein [Paenibacillus thalictri]|uniref:GNAT family N-acetyltransferase n=1 Tax=Paenibacillus thalictri TaxID=2527873 RepID=A0A4Q9DJ40_9BACL|nr:hypothetical protein [Paenibacillus thalictri]TBL71423.1 hypothetical protein EYB31_30515 [Paenibacillus thalictri]